MLLLSTDARSGKVRDLAHMASKVQGKDLGPMVELCWFFPVTREQYRLQCRVSATFSEGSLDRHIAAAGADGEGLRSLASASSTQQAQQQHVAFWKGHADSARKLFEVAQPGSVKKLEQQGDLDKVRLQLHTATAMLLRISI